MQRRLLNVFAAIILSLALPSGIVLGCMADPTDPAMAQMACCQHGHHDCGAAMGAKDCCDHGDHSPQQGFTKTFTAFNLLRKLPVATAMVLPDSVGTVPQIASAPRVILFAGTTSPPRLAFSVLLI